MADKSLLGMDFDIKTHEGIFISQICSTTIVVIFYLCRQGRRKLTTKVK